MTSHRPLLERTLDHAVEYLDALDSRPVAASASADELRAALHGPLPEDGISSEAVVDELVTALDGGLLGSAGGRFFGWVIGGALPASVAADWLAVAWDQNAAIFATSPAASVVEERCGEWLKKLLGLPEGASFALVTGCQMAHVTALAAARQYVLAPHGIDVQRDGLRVAPPIRVLASELRHATIDRAIRLLGIGTEAIVELPEDGAGRTSLPALRAALAEEPSAPAIVCLQAGELNTGAFDLFPETCELAHAHGAWVHVDGAFGLWASASASYRHLVVGIDRADSWATDGHKWLNVPQDAGFAFTAHPVSHRQSMVSAGSYFDHAAAARDEMDWNPEWSRRARGLAVYAAIRSLGRKGVEELVDRCCAQAARLVAEIGALPGAEVVEPPLINQGLVRFLDPGGDHDRRTDEVIARVQALGEAWFGGAACRGQRVMRVSVSNWRTTDEDVDRAVASVRAALAGA